MLKIFFEFQKRWSKVEEKFWISGENHQTEHGNITQAVNRDRNQQTFFFFVSDCKHDSTDNLGDRKVVSIVMGQYKKRGAEQNGRKNTPSPKKSEDDTSKKYFFPNRTDDTAHQKKYE